VNPFKWYAELTGFGPVGITVSILAMALAISSLSPVIIGITVWCIYIVAQGTTY